MRLPIAAALALLPLHLAPFAQAIPDLSTATPIAGSWTYAPAADGSEAAVRQRTRKPQLIGALHARDAARHHRQARERGGAVPQRLDQLANAQRARQLQSRNGPLRRLTAAYDPLLDAIVSSRGRVGVHRRDRAAAGRAAVGGSCARDRGLPRLNAQREAQEDCRMFTALQVLCLRPTKLIFALASTQRKEVIRCLMVQQRGRRGVFVSPRC